MADFAQFLKSDSGLAPKPQPLSAGDYPGVVKNWEVDNKNQKQTPYVRLHLGFTGWPETVPDTARVNTDGSPIDISAIQRTRDYYLVPNALWRLDAMLESCGIQTGEGHPYEEALPQLIGAPVLIEVVQKPTQDNKAFRDEVNMVKGLR